jgi:putative hydrolase of the HAD superfamily
MAIKGIIFDFDGLIIDTETPEFRAWENLYRNYDQVFPAEVYLNGVGSAYNDPAPLNHLLELMNGQLTRTRIMDELNEIKSVMFDQESLRPGVLEYLKDAKRIGIKIGLASSSERAWIDHFIVLHRIDLYFDCIRTLENVARPKPDPELFTQSVRCMQIEPDEAIALEDSYNGIVAAKQAGLYAVAVPNPVTMHSDFSQADRILNQLSDISLEELIAQF